MIEAIIRTLDEYEIIRITQSNFEQAMEVYKTNHDFFMLTDGKEAGLENITNDMAAIPPNFSIENKIYISIWKGGKIVGVLDLLMGYPAQHHVWIGLLLIHGELHGQRIGSSIARAISEAAKSAGYKAIQLGVIKNNVQGLHFWNKHGFEKTREAQRENDDGSNSSSIIVMEKRLS